MEMSTVEHQIFSSTLFLRKFANLLFKNCEVPPCRYLGYVPKTAKFRLAKIKCYTVLSSCGQTIILSPIS